MVVQQKIRLLLQLSLFSILIIFAFMLRNAMKPKHIKIHHCPCNSLILRKKLENNIDLKLLNNPENIKDKVQKLSPSLDSISILKSPTKVVHININTAKPILKLYNVETKSFTILANNKNIVNPEEYMNFFIDNLPIIYVNNSFNKEGKNFEDFYNFSINLDSEIYNQFSVHWFKNTEIHLKDKKKLVIVIDVNSINDKHKLNCAQKLFKIKENEKKIIKIDIRFRDMIILGQGGNNEKS